jgi:two-component system, OmpR family, KDP operon response regulator KdpE
LSGGWNQKLKQMSRKLSALVVDDEPQILRLLKIGLGAEKFKVSEARTAAAALKFLAAEEVDVVILDLGLPDQSGFSVLEEIRKASTVAVIVLSVRNDEAGKVRALDLGADDYITKPFGLPELTARIRVALRHRYQAKGTQPALRFGEIEIDLLNRTVSRSGKRIQLSRTEYDILQVLAEHAGKILTHAFILRAVRGEDAVGDAQYLRVYIRALRLKLGDTFGQDRIIRTEMGIGYRLTVPEPAG